jgi:Predicted transcriptional regulators
MQTVDIDNIGTRLKELRKQKIMTLNELADYTGFSTGYLSNVERNVTSPTLQSIQLICEALGTTLPSVLMQDLYEKLIIRENETRFHEYPKLHQKVYTYDFGNHKENYVMIEINPGKAESSIGFKHHYDEVGIVIQGKLTVIVDGVKYFLNERDSIYVKAQTKHELLNETDQICICYWIRKYPD